MSVRLDQRDVLDRVADIVDAADYETTQGHELARCECGATLLRFLTWDANEPVCAGCLLPPTYELHPAPIGVVEGECERDAGGATSRSLNLPWNPWRVGALLAVPAVWCVLVLIATAVSS